MSHELGNDIYVRSAAIANFDNNLGQEVNTIRNLVGTTTFESLVAQNAAYVKTTTNPSENFSVETDEDEKKQRSYVDIEDFNTFRYC